MMTTLGSVQTYLTNQAAYLWNNTNIKNTQNAVAKTWEVVTTQSPISRGFAAGFVISEFSQHLLNRGSSITGLTAGVTAFAITDTCKWIAENTSTSRKELAMITKKTAELSSAVLLCKALPEFLETSLATPVATKTVQIGLEILKNIPPLRGLSRSAEGLLLHTIPTCAQIATSQVQAIANMVLPFQVTITPWRLCAAIGLTYAGQACLQESYDHLPKQIDAKLQQYPAASIISEKIQALFSQFSSQLPTILKVSPFFLTCYLNDRLSSRFEEKNLNTTKISLLPLAFSFGLLHLAYNYYLPPKKEKPKPTLESLEKELEATNRTLQNTAKVSVNAALFSYAKDILSKATEATRLLQDANLQKTAAENQRVIAVSNDTAYDGAAAAATAASKAYEQLYLQQYLPITSLWKEAQDLKNAALKAKKLLEEKGLLSKDDRLLYQRIETLYTQIKNAAAAIKTAYYDSLVASYEAHSSSLGKLSSTGQPTAAANQALMKTMEDGYEALALWANTQTSQWLDDILGYRDSVKTKVSTLSSSSHILSQSTVQPWMDEIAEHQREAQARLAAIRQKIQLVNNILQALKPGNALSGRKTSSETMDALQDTLKTMEKAEGLCREIDQTQQKASNIFRGLY